MMIHPPLPLGPLPNRVPAHLLPWSWQVSRAPAVLLPQVLHRTRTGGFRTACDSFRLAAAVVSGEVQVEDIYMPLPGGLNWRETERLLPPAVGLQSDVHRRLVLLGHLLLLAMDPTMEVEHEIRIGGGITAFRADVVGWNGYGLATSVEAGTTDGRSIMDQLEAGHVRVVVLPYATRHYGAVRGYGFRLPGTPRLPALTAADAALALFTLRSAHETALAFAA